MFDPWQNSFPAYRDYINRELGPRPSLDHTIDRIDNDKGYEPGNIQWATAAEQKKNRRAYKTAG